MQILWIKFNLVNRAFKALSASFHFKNKLRNPFQTSAVCVSLQTPSQYVIIFDWMFYFSLFSLCPAFAKLIIVGCTISTNESAELPNKVVFTFNACLTFLYYVRIVQIWSVFTIILFIHSFRAKVPNLIYTLVGKNTDCGGCLTFQWNLSTREEQSKASSNRGSFLFFHFTLFGVTFLPRLC